MRLAYSKIIVYNKAKHYYTELLTIMGMRGCLEMGVGGAILQYTHTQCILTNFFPSPLLFVKNKQWSSRCLTLEWSCPFQLEALNHLWRSEPSLVCSWLQTRGVKDTTALSPACPHVQERASHCAPHHLLPLWAVTVWRWRSKLLQIRPGNA